jgi:hypothetical protein
MPMSREVYRHESEIRQIAIDPDGRGARVDSRELDRTLVHFSEQNSTKLVRTRHYLQIRGNFVLVTKTAYVIEKTKTSSAN